MSEPTEPGSTPETEPDTAAEATPETEPGTAPETAPQDAQLSEEAPAPATAGGAKNRQLIFIAAALVVAVAIGGGLFLAFRGDDDKASLSPSEEAKAAVIGMLEGTYKVAAGDQAGCRQLVDNIVLDPAQGDVYGRCVDKTKSTATPPPLTVDSIDVTKVDLKTADTGTVDVTVSVTLNGSPDTQSVTLPVRKVDGHWKVDPQA